MEVTKKYLRNYVCLKKSSVILLSILLFFGIFVPTKFAYAFGIGDLFGPLRDILEFIRALPLFAPFLLIRLIIGLGTAVIAVVPVMISATFLNFVLSGGFITTGYTHGGIVDIGWNITRDIANLSFIAILLVIAISTILGNEQRGAKTLLPKLIGIALIVNFTKVIAGVVVDISNIITNYFLSPITNISSLFLDVFGAKSAVWEFTGGVMGLFQNLNDPIGLFNHIKDTVSLTVLATDIISSIMIIIVSLLMSFTLFIFALIFILRYVAIWLLVILSPLAFAAMILPDTAKYARQWWQSLIKWSFIGVMPAFILFIVAKMMTLKEEMFGGDFADSAIVSGGWFQELLSPLYVIWNELIFWFVILIFMWMALMAAIKMNDKFASMTTKYAGKAMGAATGWAKDKARQRVAPAVGRRGRKLVGSKLGRIPIVGGAIKGIGEAGMRFEEKQLEKMKKERREFAKMDPRNAYTVMQREEDPERRLAAFQGRIDTEKSYDKMQEEAERAGWKKEDFEKQFELAKKTADLHPGQNIPFDKIRPDLAGDPEKIRKTTAKLTPKEWENVGSISLENETVRDAALSSPNLSPEVLKKFSPEHIQENIGQILEHPFFSCL